MSLVDKDSKLLELFAELLLETNPGDLGDHEIEAPVPLEYQH